MNFGHRLLVTVLRILGVPAAGLQEFVTEGASNAHVSLQVTALSPAQVNTSELEQESHGMEKKALSPTLSAGGLVGDQAPLANVYVV